MKFDLDGARKAGYSDVEIADHLAKQSGFDIAGARKAGYVDAEIVKHLTADSKPQQTQERSTLREVGRQVGLTARAGIKGVTALPAMVGDALGMGSSAAVERTLNQVGLPQPENSTEQFSQSVAGSMAGAGGFMGAGRVLAQSAAPVTAGVGRMLTTRPDMQVVGAGTGAASAEVAREAGAGPVGQTAAALVGGVAVPVAADIALQAGRAAGRGAQALSRPYSEQGRQQIVGSTLRNLAESPDDAARAMQSAPTYVEGSVPTAGQASRDVGLLTAERTLRASSPQANVRLSERASQQNQARNLLLNDLAGSPDDLAAMEAARAARTEPMRQAAFAQKGWMPPDSILSKADDVLASPAGKVKAVEDAMNWVKSRVANETDPERLYSVRKDINDILAGRYSGDASNFRLARKELTAVKQELDRVIEMSAPGFRQYLSEYRTQSIPITGKETLQDVRSRVLNSGSDARTGDQVMSAAKFYNVVERNGSELAKVLSAKEMDALYRISQDIKRGALSDTAGRAVGSNTAQNLSTAYVIGNMLGHGGKQSWMTAPLERSLSWLTKMSEPQVQQLLVDAMLDPRLAASLMFKATPSNVQNVSKELAKRAQGLAQGATASLSQTQPARQEQQ